MLMRLFNLIFLLLLLDLSESQVLAQDVKRSEHFFITRRDSMPHVNIDQVVVFPSKSEMSKKQLREYSILELKVRKVYPMAKLAAVKLAEYDKVYATFKSERERKEYIKKIENELFKQFEGEIRQMKVSEGRILIKLLDREIGRCSFDIIKEFKGGFSAFFWQSVARLFGHDLKAEYNPYSEDMMIEWIIWQIESGI